MLARSLARRWACRNTVPLSHCILFGFVGLDMARNLSTHPPGLARIHMLKPGSRRGEAGAHVTVLDPSLILGRFADVDAYRPVPTLHSPPARLPTTLAARLAEGACQIMARRGASWSRDTPARAGATSVMPGIHPRLLWSSQALRYQQVLLPMRARWIPAQSQPEACGCVPSQMRDESRCTWADLAVHS